MQLPCGDVSCAGEVGEDGAATVTVSLTPTVNTTTVDHWTVTGSWEGALAEVRRHHHGEMILAVAAGSGVTD